MANERDHQHPRSADQATHEDSASDDAAASVRLARAAQIGHWRREFHTLTGIDPSDPSQQDALMAWQRKHAVEPSGLIRRDTILAARAIPAPGGKSAHGQASEDAAHDVKRVPLFAGKLRSGDEPEGLSHQQWFELLSTPHRDGPSIVGPFSIRVAGVLIKRESFLIWSEGGKIQGWMPASEVPVGGSRRAEWLMWSDGRVLQVIRDRPTDATQLQAHAPRMSPRDIRDRQEAGAELNRDLEHYVASGSSIEHAQHQVYKAHRDVLVQLVQDSFRIFGIVAGAMAAEGAIEAAGGAIRRLGKKPANPGALTEESEPAGASKIPPEAHPANASTKPPGESTSTKASQPTTRSAGNTANVASEQPRRVALGTDPAKGYVAYEGEVGELIEGQYGGFERYPTPDAEWISKSGPYEGKTFDLLGIPPGAEKFHGPDLKRFLPSVDAHFRKSVDFIVLDTRNMSADQKNILMNYIQQRWASEVGRLITL